MKPLEGVKVVEMSTMITASFAAMMLAEQGATVIKVEPIELGDPMRFLGSSKGGISALFANCNRGKRSVRLDMKKPEGRRVVEELAQEADILFGLTALEPRTDDYSIAVFRTVDRSRAQDTLVAIIGEGLC